VAERLAKHKVRSGDLLFARRGEIGRHALVKDSEHGWLCGTGCFLVRLNQEVADPSLVSYFLSTDDSLEWLNRHASGVVMPNLRNQVLQKAPVQVPCLAEQKEISRILSTVERAIEAQERIIQTTTELKQALMQKLFSEGLRGEPQKETEIGLVAESWEVVELGVHCRVQSGFAFRSQDYTNGNNTIPITKIGDIQNGGVFYTERSSYVPEGFWDDRRLDQFKLNTGDVLIALTGATTGKIGVFQHSFRAFLNQRAGRFLTDEEGLKRCFLPNLVRQPYFQSEISSNILVAAQGNISPKQIEEIKIGLPAIHAQQEIASILDMLERKVACSRAKRRGLRDLFCTLLHALMTGEINVNNLSFSDQVIAINP
jgi:type I restriction enzyme S subunit